MLRYFVLGVFIGIIATIILGISNPRITIALYDNQELIKHGAAEYRWVQYGDRLRWELCWIDTKKPVESSGITTQEVGE